VHQAADGGLARVRLPGGLLSAAQLRVLAAASAELGDGSLELTSRGNLQIRALRPGAPQDLSDRLYAAGLLPSIPHERVRNILASPLSGLDHHSLYDVLPLATQLDQLLCATPALAALPGRFLFALDDGRADLAALGADVAVRVLPGGTHAALQLGGAEAAGAEAAPQLGGADAALQQAGAGLRTGGELRGVEVRLEDVPSVMVAAAEAFLAERAAQQSEAWRIAELPDGAARIYERLKFSPSLTPTTSPSLTPRPTPTTSPSLTPTPSVVAGVHEQLDGRVAVVVTVPLGSLSREQAAVLADLADQGNGQIRVTPWRSVVLGGLEAVPQLDGLVVEPESSWNGVTACAGKPGCAKALADVRADARDITPRLTRGKKPVHWSGCERRCGKPASGFVDVVAVGNGYLIDGEPAETDLAAAVARGMGT
jgi:precorrin-3B synthase